MQKFTRSLLAAGAVFGLAACGDDVSVTAPPPPPAAVVTGVTVSPAAITIGVGEKVILSAAVAVSAGSGTPNTTVAWSSANAAIASVSATTGEVTGVAIGTTTIRATAGGITGAAAVTVRAATGSNAATVSISSITQGGLGNPVALNNVQGQIDVTLNVEPNDQRVTKVAVLVDGVEVASQAFTASAAVEASAAAVPITLSFNTAAFNATTGATTFKNGPKTISAKVEVAAGTQPAATAGIPVVFNNQSGFVIDPQASKGVQTASTGLAWIGGDITVKLLPVIYTTDTVTSATILAMGRSGVANSANSYTVVFPNTAFSAATNPRGIAGYQTETNALAAGGPTEVISVSSVLSTGQAGPTTLLNYLTTTPVAGNTAVPLVGFIRVDNKAPVILPAQVGTVPTWLNATYALNSTNLGHVAMDTANVNGVTPVTGVSGITYTYYVGATLPGAANACDFTGLTAVTSGADLAETIVSTSYRMRAAATDKLGNQSCFDVDPATPTFGVDKTAPTIVSLTGPADLSAATAPGVFAATVTDNASGFGANPVKYSMTRLNANGSTSCLVGTSAATCATTVDSTTLTFSATNGSATDGYYTTTATVRDQAGNATSLLTRTYLLDAVAPAFSGAISAPPLITGGATNTFTALITDNLDLNEIFGTVAYPVGASLEYAAQSFGSFGAPLEQSATAAYSISNFIRCLNAAGAFALNAGNKASTITLTLSDQADNTVTSAAAITPNVAACGDVGNATDALGNYSAPNSFGPTTVAYGTGLTSVWNGGGTQPATAGTSATLTAIADVPLNTSGNPFSSVNFYYQTASGSWALIGTSAGVLAQTPANRTWTYTFSWTPTAAGFPAAGSPYNVVAIGIDAQGDAVLTAPVAVAVSGS